MTQPMQNDVPPSPAAAETALPKMLKPGKIAQVYGLPRDRVYTAIHTGELKALDVGTPVRAAFLCRIPDIEAWLESLTYGGKK